MLIEIKSHLGISRGRTVRRGAFTLVELLIVVAIVAILSAIATPNFLEAQTRAKVSRVYSDMRTLKTAIESYTVDFGKGPYITDTFQPLATRLSQLTTPVAYLTTFPNDPFRRNPGTYLGQGDPLDPDGNNYLYNTGHSSSGASASGSPYDPRRAEWSLTSSGPDLEIIFPYYAFAPNYLTSKSYLRFIYDPTNGTQSPGEIFARGGASRYALPEIDN
jgi:prepilin-type N-terminal cleavage/methylation domain-containing protein